MKPSMPAAICRLVSAFREKAAQSTAIGLLIHYIILNSRTMCQVMTCKLVPLLFPEQN